MAKTKKVAAKEQDKSVIKGYTLTSTEKLRIAAEGDGREFPGVGWENEDALLAEYDKRGGAIFTLGEEEDENGDPKAVLVKLQNGVFYDFKAKRPRSADEEKPKKKAKRPSAKGVTTKRIEDKA